MYPAYPYSYPHHNTPMPYAPNDDPRAKETTHHMKMDPSTMISPYQQPWSYGANYPYPVPHEYHGCCNHGYYGGGPYSYRPPYPHYPPPPPPPSLYSHGFYPPFPGAYPGYHIPPPHYSVEQPRYDYDKNNHDGQRCSRCTRVEDEKKPRVVQEEPEVDKKTNGSLVPLLLKDCPYPFMWVPPGYMKTEPEATEKENNTLDPVSPKHLEPVKQGGKGEIAQNQKDGDDYNHFPYQIFWLPSKNKELKNETFENNVNLIADKGMLDEKKPLRMKDNNGSGSETESDTSGGKHAVQKVIPVKQLHTNEGQKSPKVIQTKAKSDSMKNTDIDIEGKASPKASKLPPVCLRIDPLPGKKKNSRSPSPPADKQRSQVSTLDHPKTSQQQMDLSEGLKKGRHEQSKSNIKNIQVTDDVQKVEKDRLANPCEDAAKGEGDQKGMVREVEKKKLSEHEAVLIIQSAYRGFEVRKSQPLTKLRQINGVRKQVAELRNRIQDLESPSSTIRIDDKQKLIIGETIMSLLLKLDTIQGLHPVVRDARKSVAKELVGLQEKLDSLTLVKSETPSVKTHLEEDAIQDKSGQGQAQSYCNIKLVDSDLGICENQGQATESQDVGAEVCDTSADQQIELYNENTSEESINNQLHVSVETEQHVDNTISDKFDQPQADSDCNTKTVGLDTCEAEDANAVHKAHDIKPKQVGEQDTKELLVELPLDNAIQEKHEADETVPNIEFVESDEACAGVGDINLDAQVESESQQDTVELTRNQLEMVAETESPVENGIQVKSDRVESDTNVEFVESDDSCADVYNVNLTPQVESESQDIPSEPTNNQTEIAEEQPTEEEKFDEKQAMPEINDQKQALSEINVENVESCEHPRVESIEFQDDVNVKTHDALPPKTMVDVDLPIEDATNEVQGDFIVSTEEAPKADDADSSAEVVIEDLGGVSPISPTGSCGDDKKLMEENEKLRSAVEELMKAGNQQLDVIKELTGRVKDLEKKLSKKKKVKPNKGRCRGSVVKDELRSCLV